MALTRAQFNMIKGKGYLLAEVAALTDYEDGQHIYVSGRTAAGDGYEGMFVFNETDLSTEVTSDTEQGIYIAPDADATGGSGAWVRDYDTRVDPMWFGATFDGLTDDSSALICCLAVAPEGATVFGYPGASCLIEADIAVTKAVTLQDFLVIPNLGAAGGVLFDITASNVHFKRITFDASTLSYTLTGNEYLFQAQHTATLYNLSFEHISVNDWTMDDGLTSTSNLLVSHCIYVDDAVNVRIANCRVEAASGAAVFTRDIYNLQVVDNWFEDCHWYPIHLNSGVSGFTIDNNDIVCTGISEGVYWGGMIDLMSQQGEERNGNGWITNNRLNGYISYGAVIRITSSDNIYCSGNILSDINAGSWAASNDMTGIRVGTRGISTSEQNGPCQNIHIKGNRIIAPAVTASHRAIYVSNDWQTANTPLYNLWIEDNTIESVNSSYYFCSAIIIHGMDGGIENVHVKGNIASTITQSGLLGDGAVAFVANNANGAVKKIFLNGNALTDLGTPASSYQVGIAINAYTDEVFNLGRNYLDNFQYGVRTFATAGTHLHNIDEQYFTNMGSVGFLAGAGAEEYGINSDGSTGGTSSAGSGNQYIGITLYDPGSSTFKKYKVLHDGVY